MSTSKKNKNEIRGFLLDIDGTILNTQRHIPEGLFETLNKLIVQGYSIGLCSGRTYASICNFLLSEFSQSNCHVLSGGAALIRNDGNILWEKRMSHEVVWEITQEVSGMGAAYCFGIDRICYADPLMLKVLKKSVWSIELQPVQKLNNWSTSLLYVRGINKDIEAYIENHPRISYKRMRNSNGDEYYDITTKGINKATAAKLWAEKMCLDPSDIAVIGDSLNDIEAMEVVGLAIAMGNAREEVKNIADLVIGHVDEDGLRHYLSQFVRVD